MRLQKTTKLDDDRILSFVKRNPFMTSRQVNNTHEKVGVSMLKSKLKRHSINVNTEGLQKCTNYCQNI